VTAPFALPDLMDVRNANDDDTLYFNVPCRQVPRLFNWLAPSGTSTNTDFYGVSHYVDFDSVYDLVDDEAELVAAGIWRFDYDGSYILVVTAGPFTLRLRVIYFELRYTNTEREYYRFYCQRLSITGA